MVLGFYPPLGSRHIAVIYLVLLTLVCCGCDCRRMLYHEASERFGPVRVSWLLKRRVCTRFVMTRALTDYQCHGISAG